MKVKKVSVRGFRLLQSVELTLHEESTVIVGRNNAGKTSLTELFRRVFSSDKFSLNLEDFSLSSAQLFKEALQLFKDNEPEEKIRETIPVIELMLFIDYESESGEYGQLSDFIIDLEEDSYEAQIKISYQVQDGKISNLFSDLDDDHSFYDQLKERIPKLYTTKVFAIDPTDPNNFTEIPFSKIKKLMNVNFINAQRGLDDVTQAEKDVLGKVLGKIFQNSSLENAPIDVQEKAKALEETVERIQGTVDGDFTDKVKELLPALATFGYPGLSDPQITTKTTLSVSSILQGNTKIRYQRGDHFSLPETYNGLGSRNLIYILFQLFEFFREYQSNPQDLKNHLVFIEEPEAHLHPQMQEVFIRQLSKVAQTFCETLNGGNPWPVQFVVSTHSTHIANEADFDSIRYFLSQNDDYPITNIKDFNVAFNDPTMKDDKEFIHKYLTLTKCDLFFADKAILIEGTSERLLIPEFIDKVDQIYSCKLSSQYISVIEVGGAYAHLFYKFLDFLELKTLVITDLDSTRKNENSKYEACPVNDGSYSSNAGLKNWFQEKDDNFDLVSIQAKTNKEKINNVRRIAYQIPEEGKTVCGRSFEDAFILANRSLFGLDATSDAPGIAQEAYDLAQDVGKSSKANFALKYSIEETNWKTPKYIEEGLIWLAEMLPSDTGSGS